MFLKYEQAAAIQQLGHIKRIKRESQDAEVPEEREHGTKIYQTDKKACTRFCG